MSKRMITKYITPEMCSTIKKEIAGNNGNEVFFHGNSDKSGVITDVTPLAWGNENSTPALLQKLSPGQVVIHNHPSGNLTPSQADVQIASIVGNQGVGFYIVNNDASDIKVVVERDFQADLKLLDPAVLASKLDEDSLIARTLQGYESRQSQMDMAAEVAVSFNQGNVSLFEAGTGTGKTLAYLLPAIEWALLNKERVVISTKTINLQEQLVYKDIPFLKKVIDDEFNAVLVKGRGNYSCLRKVDSEEKDLGLFKDEDDVNELVSLIKWSKETSDGSLADLNYIPKSEVWDRIKCESDTCTGVKCQFYEDCFLVKARRRAAAANIVIVNHHLLFSDIALRGSLGSLADVAVLPPYTRVIIDEAHHVESVSTDYYGTQISQNGIKRLLGRLVSLSKKGEKKGLLPRTLAKLRKLDPKLYDDYFKTIAENIDTHLIFKKMELAEFAEDIFSDITAFLRKRNHKSGDEKQVVIDDAFYEDPEWMDFISVKLREWIKRMREYIVDFNADLENLEKKSEKSSVDLENLIIELSSVSRRMTTLADDINYLFFEHDNSVVKWIEFVGNGKSLKVKAAPIEVGEFLKNTLFDVYETVVMTSATLTVEDSFDFMNSRLGLDRIDHIRLDLKKYPSPFNYKQQVLIGIPTNIHPPDHPAFNAQSAQFIAASITISVGRAFVLFTSYSAMNTIHNYVKDEMDNSITFLKQGNETRTHLLERFKKETAPVLFATDSFWEGVDVIGEDLESIIIARLPFRVPTQPIEVARREAIEKSGGNSFTEYTVPQAIIKFKQGFGRLIRSKSDRGTIFILDNRIVSKAYGKMFLESLPDCGLVIGRDDEVFKAFREFFA